MPFPKLNLLILTALLSLSLELPVRSQSLQLLAQISAQPTAEAERLLNLCREYLPNEQAETAIKSCRKSIKESQNQKLSKKGLILAQSIDNDQKAQADKLLQQGREQFQISQFREALKYWKQALAIYREIVDQQGESNSLNNMGIAYYSLGEYQRAIELFKQTLVIAREISDAKGTRSLRQIEAGALGNMGSAYHSLGDYQRAIEFHQQQLTIARAIGNRQGEATSLNNLGLAYDSLGDYQRAIEFHQQSLTIKQEIGDSLGEARSLNNLGVVYQSLRDYQRAIEFHQQQLTIARAIGNRQEEATSLGNLGSAYDSLKEYQRAIDFYQQSLTIKQEIGARQGEAKSWGNLGNAYGSMGKYQRAINFHQQQLTIMREIGDSAEEGLTLNNIGHTLEYLKDTDLAIIFYKQSVNVRESIRHKIRNLSREQQQSYKETVAEDYQRLATILLEQNRVMEALLVLDLLKVQELQDFFKDVQSNERTAQGIELLPQEKQILSALDTNPNLDLNTYLQSSSVKALAQEIHQTAPAQNLQFAAYSDLQTQLSNLGQNSALFYPLVLDDRIELVLFTRNAPPIHQTFTISKKELETAVANFRTEIQNTTSDAIQKPAQKLYQWLIEPIAKELQQQNIKTIIYAPDGQMRYVPLAALYDGEQWLVEKYQINYITALSLTDLETASFQNPSILAGAFTEARGQVKINDKIFDFGPIPFAQTEVEALAKTFPSTKVLRDQNFSRNGMNPNQMNRHNIVHLATHGKLVSGNPEDSFILLNNQEYITLREIKDWQLPNVGLVVLSACQTALGDTLGSGIEIIGFGYQLQQAQARASIATLWSINDAATSDLMNEFYAQIKQSSPNPVNALRDAQIALIQGNLLAERKNPRVSLEPEGAIIPPEEQLKHPYYWAPFILIGNGF